MTTTAKAKAKPVKHDLTHGPVAAAFNASVWPMCFAAIGKWTGGIAPWMPLVAATVLAACLALAGAHRKPRPLSRVSILYRAGVTMTIGGWTWFQLATFPDVHLAPAVFLAWGAVLALTFAAVAVRRMPPMLLGLVPAAALLTASVITLFHLNAAITWVTSALTVTDKFGHGHDSALAWLGFAVLFLVLVGAPLAVLGVTFANQERSADEELALREQQNAPRTPAGEARAFLRLICKLTNEYTEVRPSDPSLPGKRIPNLSVTDVKFWENGAGETYVIDLTKNEKGTTRTKLRTYVDDIATKMNLPHGCGVEILPARDAGGEIMGAGFAAVDISRVNVLKQIIEYPELQPRSILNPLPLGRTRSNKEIGPMLRESSAFLWGQKGSGKTGTIYDIVLGAMQCTDCLVWVIDLNRGNAAKPFLRAWYEGKVNRPCVDWVATTIDEVVHMAQVGLQIALDRKGYYADLKFELDTNLMPVGNGGPGQPPPEILIVIDEGAEVLGIGGGSMTDEGRAAREAINQIMNLGRDAATNIVFSGLRATADVADTAFKAGTNVRIGMRVTDDAELAHGFGEWHLSGKQIPYKGSGYIRCGHDDGEDDSAGDDIVVFKAYYLAPKRMAAAGEQVTPWRPYLDERSLRTAGMTYANRWRRTARLLWDNPPPEVLNFGARPGQNDSGTIDGEIVNQPPTGPAGATAVATVDPLTDLKASGLSRPTGGSWDDMIKQANEQAEARKRREAQGAGGGGEGTAPAAYQPPTGPAEPDRPAEPAQPTEPASIEEQFDQIAKNMTVLPGEPERPWNRSGKITPEQELSVAPSNSREILERLVKIAGPLRAGQMHEMLIAGGDWGPAVQISKVAMHQLLKEPKSAGGGPAKWLAPRQAGEPYNHRDNVSG